jgi:two-component system, sensor histidine kinase and response regulator
MILIVDDKKENLFALKQVLELNKFEVDTASSGEEALIKLLKNEYALIILDVQMPVMDGFEVAEAISGSSKAKDIPIIFLSAVNTDKRFITKGYSSGGMDYVAKPVDPDILLLKVKTFYRLYEQKRELQQTQEDLREEIEIRKKAESKKDEFISIASHELKTPLTSIKAYFQILQMTVDTLDKDTIKKYIARCHQQIEKLNDLVRELLDISQIENGKIRFSMEKINFQDVLNSTLEMIRQTNDEVIIKVEGSADVMIIADEMRIEQVLINYLTNAIKYSPSAKEVTVKLYVQGKQLKVSVKDNGIGIPKDKQPFIFDKFYRAEDATHHFQGLGIGLFICAEILRRHSGTYGVYSEPGNGSEFYFTLPIVD